MFDNFRGALERTDLADSGHVFSVPLDAELEILVRIETLSVDAELGHRNPPYYLSVRSSTSFERGMAARISIREHSPLRRNLSGHLLNLDHDKLRRLERRESDNDVDDAEIDVVLRRRCLVALDEVSFTRRLSLKRALAKQVLHECA